MLHDQDEGIRPDTSLEGLAKLPVLKKGGIITAGLASQICDGAAAMLIVNGAYLLSIFWNSTMLIFGRVFSEEGLKKLRAINPEIKPRAKIIAMALAGSDPVM